MPCITGSSVSGRIPLIPWRNNLLMATVSLYLLLNYGFMQLRLPPIGTGGIPVGEAVLLFSLATINYSRLYAHLSSTIFLFPLLVWWGLGIGRALAGIPAYGMWSLRDASHVLESLFLIAGFVFAARPQHLEQFFSWLPKLLAIIGVHALLFPFHRFLHSLSPRVVGGSGQEVTLFFHFSTASVCLLMLVAYLLLFGRATGWNFALVVFLVGYLLVFFQARKIYLQILAFFLLFVLFRRDLIGKGVLAILLVVLLLTLMPLLELEVAGRMGKTASIEFLYYHFLSMGGVESEGLEGAAAGIYQRIAWWLNLYARWTSGIGTFLFGLGYGFPLVHFGTRAGIPVREPHNSYISIIARIGLVGILAFAWMHVQFLKTWWGAIRRCEDLGWQEGKNRLLLLMVYFVLVWIFAIGEDAFEKPYHAIPYYFFWGIALRFARHLNQGHIGPGRRDDAHPAGP